MIVSPETCDDGGSSAGDGCSATCTTEPNWTCNGLSPTACVPTPNDGIAVGSEVCDDGDPTDGAGCLADGSGPMPGYSCPCTPTCTCTPICGDAYIIAPENCEHGNTANGDGCSSTCTVETGW